MTEILQIDGNKYVALVLQGALVLETVLYVVKGRVVVAIDYSFVTDAHYVGQRQHNVECLAQPYGLLGTVYALSLQFTAHKIGQL